MGHATAIFFCPNQLGPWGGVKGQISFNFNYKVNFKDFLYQTLRVFSQMKDTKYIRRDFHSFTWIMPQGWDLGHWGAQGVKKLLGVPWGVGVKKIFFRNSTRFGV